MQKIFLPAPGFKPTTFLPVHYLPSGDLRHYRLYFAPIGSQSFMGDLELLLKLFIRATGNITNGVGVQLLQSCNLFLYNPIFSKN